MIHAGDVLQYSVEFAAVAVAGYFVVTMWRRRSDPTARPLLAVAAIVFTGTLTHLAVVHPNPIRGALLERFWTNAGGPLWIGVLSLVVILAGGFWFLFALQYTGRAGRLVSLSALGLVGFWVALLVVAVFGDLSPPAELQAEATVEVTLSIGMFLTSILMTVGALLILSTSLQRNAVRLREGSALAAGASLLAFTPTMADNLLNAIIVPVMVTVASGLFIGAIHRYPTFDAPPVARIAGRDRLVEEMDDPVVVVDREDKIRDLNPAGEQYFDADRQTILGEPFEALFSSAPEPADVATADEPIRLETGAESTFEITGNPITDARGRWFGYLFVCRDVTERRRRERRLGVLNQLLTNAVSDQMGSIVDETNRLLSAETDADPDEQDFSELGSAVRMRTTELLDLVARAREIERVLAEGGVGSAEVGETIRRVSDNLARDGRIDLDIRTDEAVWTSVDPAVLETILESLVADALEHSTERVEIAVVESRSQLEVMIADNRAARNPPYQSRGDAETDERDARKELLVSMVRLAVQQFGGDVRILDPEASDCQTVVALPRTDGEVETDSVSPTADTTNEADAQEAGERP